MFLWWVCIRVFKSNALGGKRVALCNDKDEASLVKTTKDSKPKIYIDESEEKFQNGDFMTYKSHSY